jgi:O-antigen/teichoic acid export membrane protein
VRFQTPTPRTLGGHAVTDSSTPPPTLSRAELSTRVARSIFAGSALGVAALLIGFFGNLVLARLLVPRDFGIVAIGATVLLVASAFGDAGLGAGMIRWPRDPTRDEYARLTGVQLLITGMLVVSVGAVALRVGGGGDVVAVMLLAMPVTALQTPGRIKLMREVRLGLMSGVDALASLVFYAWSIALALAGFGVWGLATGTVVRAVVGTALVWVAANGSAVPPSFRNLMSLRPLFGFGIRYQAAWLVIVVRDIVVNVVTGAVGGVSTLGLWSLGRRLMELPLVLVSTLLRVSFPALSHVLAAGEDARPLVERSSRVVAVVSGFALAAFAGLLPALIPVLFGDEWEPVGELLAWTTVAVLATVALSVVPGGYLQAANRPGAMLRAASVAAVVWIVATAALLPTIGLVAVGIGWLLASVTEGILLIHAAKAESGARVASAVGLPLLVGVGGCVTGAVLGLTFGPGVLPALVAAAAAVAITGLGFALFARPQLLDAIAQVRSTAAHARARPAS